MAKVTWTDVSDMRERYDAGEDSQRALAKEFGLCKTTVAAIVNRRLWK